MPEKRLRGRRRAAKPLSSRIRNPIKMKTVTPGLDRSKTYSRDLPLFRQLGLQPFEVATGEEAYFVGMVILEDGAWVRIWVDCAPAQFWTFCVRSKEGAETRFKTGSGALSDYWPTAKLFADARIVVTSFQ